jgi:ASC-1-like (ASCH) protein
MSVVEKRIWPQFFELVRSGKKNVELRVADFDVKPGDVIVLREWSPEIKDYTGREIRKKVSFVNKVDVEKFGQIEKIRKHGVYLIEME